jgi:molybdopterin adenylyltransferase
MSEFIFESINTSEKKGTKKFPVNKVILKKRVGITEDAHKGMKNREISLLSREEIDSFKSDLPNGSFGENITTKGLDSSKIRLLDYIKVNNVLLQISKIGKECHDRCHIYKSMGDCIMPKKGYFCRVLKGGVIRSGDKAIYSPRQYKVAIITVSDRASTGVYQDKSGPQIRQKLDEYFSAINRQCDYDSFLVPDSKIKLGICFLKLLFNNYDLIVTTGGTGVSKRDITIEVVRRFIKKELPGISEFIRNKYGQNNKNALVSRSVVGVNGRTLICAMPGSTNAVTEYMNELIPMFDHLFNMMSDVDSH